MTINPDRFCSSYGTVANAGKQHQNKYRHHRWFSWTTCDALQSWSTDSGDDYDDQHDEGLALHLYLVRCLPGSAELTRDGKVVPYANSLSYETVNAKRNHVCEEENLPEPVLLKPNEPRVADWFLLVNDRTTEDADAWYEVFSTATGVL